MTDGKLICDLCHGSGTYSHRDDLDGECPKCHGEGKLDWVENVVGKDPRPKNPYLGQTIFDNNDNSIYVWSGSSWHLLQL